MADPVEKRRVVLGISGSIAAYKSAELARLFVSRGYEVRVVMSDAATQFITPLTMQAVTGKPVNTTFWEEASGIGHIELADWADVLVIAPASADCIAKLAVGMADNSLLAVALATRAPIVIAPAMNVNMFEHAATQENIEILRKRGADVVDPEEGELACGWQGTGRLADPWEIFQRTRRALSEADYRGKRVLITTGPTREMLDPVRFLSNRSSGKMGMNLAREAFRRGADVTLVHGPVDLRVPSAVRCLAVTTALEMHRVTMAEAFPPENPPDIVIMAAAVADFRPAEASESKIKKSAEVRSIALEQNPDILADLGAKRGTAGAPVLVGFAVETGEIEELLEEARSKLQRKNADMIVGNFAEDALELNTNRVWLVNRHGKQEEVATAFKSRVANKILSAVLKLQ